MALVPYQPPLFTAPQQPIISQPLFITTGLNYTGSIGLIGIYNPTSQPKPLVKRPRTKFVNEQKQVLDSFGVDCMELIISYLDMVSKVNLLYTSKYFYNLRKLDHSDLSHYIHQNCCLKQTINADQMGELLERNNCPRSLKFIWNAVVNDYRKDVKGYATILEKIACEYDVQKAPSVTCKLCYPPAQTFATYADSLYIGGYTVHSIENPVLPPVENSINLGQHSVALEDGEIPWVARITHLLLSKK